MAENRAKVVLAEAEVPMAMADAFRKGNLEVLSRNGRTLMRSARISNGSAVNANASLGSSL